MFGIPPMKLGWVQTGKMSNPESQLEAWYDVVESYHYRIASMINHRVLPILGISDFVFKFNTIRPSKEKVMAEVIRAQGQAIAALRQEGVITINEARMMLGYDMLQADKANDPFFVSPKLSINQGAEAAAQEGDENTPTTDDNEEDAPIPPEDREEALGVPWEVF